MKAGWEVKALGDAFQTVTGNTPSKSKKHFYGKDVPLVKPPELTNGEVHEALDGLTDEGAANARVAPQGSVLVSCIGNLGKIGLATKPLAFNQQINAIYPDATVSIPKFIFYFTLSPQFTAQLADLAAGTTVPIVNKSRFNSIEIPLPPLEEQKRIVAVLDAAFEGLTRARTHAETNLQNARELFEGGIRTALEQATQGWVQAPLERCFRLKSGDNLTSKAMVSGQYNVYGGNGVAGQHNRTNLTGQNVIVGRVGALCGRARYITEDIWLTDNAFKVTEPKFNFDFEFLARLLNFMDLRSLARQAAQPVISNSSLKDLTLSFPEDIRVQVEIARTISELENKTENLQAHYRTKLQDLDDLRQSLLARAFAGELT